MINFYMSNLDAMLEELRAARISVEVDPQPLPERPLCPLD